MEELVFINNNRPMTTSRTIADVFEKKHQHVLRDIDLLKDVSNFGHMFIETTEPDSYGRNQRVYEISRDGFSLLAMGFTGQKALEWKIKYINAFNTMEETIKNHVPQGNELIALAVIEAHKQLEEKDKQIERMKPKEIFADAVATSSTSILVGELAKILKQNGVDIGQNRLFAWMRDNKYLMSGNEPTQKSMELKLFEVMERTVNNPDGTVRITRTTKVTGKGQQYFVNKFLVDVA